jgi:hypothetical protein
MKYTPKTQPEIDHMILALGKQRDKLPEYNVFGGNNHLTIDTQIEILKGQIISEDDIYDREDEFGDACSDIAMVFDWMKGHFDDSEIVDNDCLPELNTPVSKINVCAKQCNECPFSNKSIPGWLADYTTEDIQQYMFNEAFFPCHKMMKEDDMTQDQVQEAIQAGEIKFCRGYVESMIKSAKMPYKNKLLVEVFKKVKEEGLSETSMDIMEFREHHTKLTKK